VAFRSAASDAKFLADIHQSVKGLEGGDVRDDSGDS